MRQEPVRGMTSLARGPHSLPHHVAIIMDGNGRWARRRHLPRAAGHVAGVAAVRAIVRASIDLGLSYLTLYAFSSENWKRPQTEVTHLMGLFRAYFRDDVDELVSRNVRMRIIGSRRRAENDILAMIEDGETRTANNTGLNLTFAFDYGAQEEIVAAVREMAKAVARGELDPDAITPAMFGSRLLTCGLPDPDLLIRTSGERRLSNFLLWQSAYSELAFVDTLWPDFTRAKFFEELEAFAQRERRFGAVTPEAVA
jgi:undecaprenyl diphosphate synthase